MLKEDAERRRQELLENELREKERIIAEERRAREEAERRAQEQERLRR